MATPHGDKTLELKVGGFVLVGLGVLAVLLVQFGRIGEGFQHYYGLLVKFPDASGLLKGSDVLLAGAKIGHVSGGPRLDDLTKEGGALVTDLRTAVQNANAAILKLNDEALSQTNLDNVKSAVENLNTATTALAASTRKIDGVLDKASETMDSAKKAADDLPGAIADARKTIQAATETIQKASSGKGALATLLTNQEFANDLRALVSNLRAHGVLFYRDSAAREEARPAPER